LGGCSDIPFSGRRQLKAEGIELSPTLSYKDGKGAQMTLCPDLKPVEDFHSVLKSDVAKYYPRPTNIHELKAVVEECCDKFEEKHPGVCRKYIYGIEGRCKKLVENKGKVSKKHL